MADPVPVVRLKPEYHPLGIGNKVFGIGVFDEQNRLIGVLTLEEFRRVQEYLPKG